MKQYLTTILLTASVLIGEVHTFWEKLPVKQQNWILTIDRTMAVQWNVKFVSLQVNYILIAVALMYYHKNRLNVTAAAVFVLFQVADFLLYFYNYKTAGYGFIYIGLAAFGFIHYKWINKLK